MTLGVDCILLERFRKTLVCAIIVGLLSSSCATLGIQQPLSYDNRSISLQTLSLFDQSKPSSFSDKDWRGDWLFRRERLALIDKELRSTRPDLVLFQEMMSKKDSVIESDAKILGAGALRDYDWDTHEVHFEESTQEQMLQGAAVSLPLRKIPLEDETQSIWKLGMDGVVSLSVISLDQQNIFVFNVKMPQFMKGEDWYEQLTELIEKALEERKLCPQRLIVAGFLPGGMPQENYENFIKDLELKDTSYGRGLCEIASECYTGTPMNELFMLTSQKSSPGQFDRILVHQSTIVNNSQIVYNKAADHPSQHAKSYGLSKLWPSRRFGWSASIRLARCEN